jgi:SAM-dependent methyltransferase
VPPELRQVLAILIGVIVCFYLVYQARKPDRWMGRLFLKRMNVHHSATTDWGLEHVRIERGFHILDVGCGGGRTIEKLAARAPEGLICGVDYAAGSIAESQSRNAKAIEAGRVQIQRASVDKLPYSEGSFDLATAIETHYYWPNLVGGLREIRRVLRPDATLLVIAESHRGARGNWLHRLAMAPLRAVHLRPQELADAFTQAGFASVEVRTHPNHGWICAWGIKN